MENEPRVFRVGIDGIWRDVAEAVRKGARTTHAVAMAIRRPADTMGYTLRRADTTITRMMEKQLLRHDPTGRIILTRKGFKQLGHELEYMDIDEARGLGLTPGPHSGPRSPDEDKPADMDDPLDLPPG